MSDVLKRLLASTLFSLGLLILLADIGLSPPYRIRDRKTEEPVPVSAT
jgi:hypothetical protein